MSHEFESRLEGRGLDEEKMEGLASPKGCDLRGMTYRDDGPGAGRGGLEPKGIRFSQKVFLDPNGIHGFTCPLG